MAPRAPAEAVAVRGDRTRRRAAVVAAVCLLAVAGGGAAALLGARLVVGQAEPAAGAQRLGLPLSFEPNVGQADPAVRFVSHGPRGTLYLTPSEAIVALLPRAGATAPDVLRMRLLGARPDVELAAGDARTGTANYLVGDDAERWRTGVPLYGRVTYRGLYPGIDLVYHAAAGQLEYDFDVAPGADPAAIALRLDGARSVRIDRRGRLRVRLARTTLVQDAPRMYELRDGARHAVGGRFVLRGARDVGFAVDRHDRRRRLVIDPRIAFSTTIGGSGDDVATAVAVDRAGSTYVAGTTSSADLPLRRPLRGGERRPQPVDAFVAKLDRAGRLVHATYLGGSRYSDAHGIAVDRRGQAYVTGSTGSPDFPTTRGALQERFGGPPFDAYVAKLSAAGDRLVYATFLGGPRNDRGHALAVAADGSVVAVGRTAHDGFPTAGRLRHAPDGGATVTRIAAGGRRAVYATVLGGADRANSSNTAFGVALDRHANAYVAGSTSAPDFPTVAALQPRFGGGASNAFVTKIDARGRRIAYSTYLGGGGEDGGSAIAVDRRGRAYVTGQTTSADFPRAGAGLPGRAGSAGSDAFVAMIGAGGRLGWSALIGGSGDDGGRAIAVNDRGNAFVAGRTRSPDFPLADAAQARLGGAGDAFVTALARAGTSIVRSTYLGGSGDDEGLAIALDRRGDVVVAGQSESTDFAAGDPTSQVPAGARAASAGGGSAFVTRIAW